MKNSESALTGKKRLQLADDPHKPKRLRSSVVSEVISWHGLDPKAENDQQKATRQARQEHGANWVAEKLTRLHDAILIDADSAANGDGGDKLRSSSRNENNGHNNDNIPLDTHLVQVEEILFNPSAAGEVDMLEFTVAGSTGQGKVAKHSPKGGRKKLIVNNVDRGSK